jgi:hypothetical protein
MRAAPLRLKGDTMMWETQATLADRQRGLATLTAACARENVVLLELRTNQLDDGRFADTALLATPGGFKAADVEHLYAGIDLHGDITVGPGDPRRLDATDELGWARRRRRLLIPAGLTGRVVPTHATRKGCHRHGPPIGHLRRAMAAAALVLTTSRS